jgi:hypothetical protein
MTQVGHARETKDNTTAPLISDEAADGLKSAMPGRKGSRSFTARFDLYKAGGFKNGVVP